MKGTCIQGLILPAADFTGLVLIQGRSQLLINKVGMGGGGCHRHFVLAVVRIDCLSSDIWCKPAGPAA